MLPDSLGNGSPPIGVVKRSNRDFQRRLSDLLLHPFLAMLQVCNFWGVRLFVLRRLTFRRLTISLIAIELSFALLADAEQLPVHLPQTLSGREGAALWPAVAQAKV